MEDPDPYLLDFLPQTLAVFLPLSPSLALGLGILLLLLLFSALVSAAETAYFSLSPLHVEAMGQDDSARSRRVAQLLKHPRKLLATILISNTLAKVSVIILATFLTLRYTLPGPGPYLLFL
ncbi:MAG TPA: DUF21 domain-containing protein, partial [Bacteroidales bacterium]|nr:DUF21 domain-containing protein [Bacteroidales bacterium]